MSGPPAKAPKDELAKLFQKQEKYLLEMDYKKVICSSFFKPKINFFLCRTRGTTVEPIDNFNPAPLGDSRNAIENYYKRQSDIIRNTFNNIAGGSIDRKINNFNRIKDNSTKGYKAYKIDNTYLLFYQEIYCSYVLNDLDIASVFTQFDSFNTKMSATKSPIPPNEVNYTVIKANKNTTNIVGTNILPIFRNVAGLNFINNNIRFHEDNRKKISDRLVNSDKNNNIVFESNKVWGNLINHERTELKSFPKKYNIFELYSGNKLVIHNDNNKNINVIKYQNIPNLLENNEYNNTFYNNYLIEYLYVISYYINNLRGIAKDYNLLEILRHNSNFENYEDILEELILSFIKEPSVESFNENIRKFIFHNKNDNRHNNRRLNNELTTANNSLCKQNMSNFGFIIKLLPSITVNNMADTKTTRDSRFDEYFFSNIASYACIYVDNNRRKIYAFCPGLRYPYNVIIKRLVIGRNLEFGQRTNNYINEIGEIYDIIQNDKEYLSYNINNRINSHNNIIDFISKDNIYSNCANAYTVNPIENQNLLGEDSTTYSLNLTDFSLMYCNYFLAVMSGNIPDAKGVPIISYDDPFEAYFDEFFKTINHADFKDKGVIDKKKYTQHVEERCDFIGNLFYTDLGDHFSKNYKSKWNKDKPVTP